MKQNSIKHTEPEVEMKLNLEGRKINLERGGENYEK